MRFLLFSLCVFFLWSGCKNTPKNLQQSKSDKELPQDFWAFYQQFHSDSAFQMAHIEWPLKGEKGIARDSSLQQQLFEWTPESWQLMHLPDTSMSTLKREYETVSNVLIIERMYYPMVGFGFERQFFKEEDNQWRLIYYAEKPMAQ